MSEFARVFYPRIKQYVQLVMYHHLNKTYNPDISMSEWKATIGRVYVGCVFPKVVEIVDKEWHVVVTVNALYKNAPLKDERPLEEWHFVLNMKTPSDHAVGDLNGQADIILRGLHETLLSLPLGECIPLKAKEKEEEAKKKARKEKGEKVAEEKAEMNVDMRCLVTSYVSSDVPLATISYVKEFTLFKDSFACADGSSGELNVFVRYCDRHFSDVTDFACILPHIPVLPAFKSQPPTERKPPARHNMVNESLLRKRAVGTPEAGSQEDDSDLGLVYSSSAEIPNESKAMTMSQKEWFSFMLSIMKQKESS